MGDRRPADLVVNALVMALVRRTPRGELIHHADRGSQYTSLKFANRLKAWTVTPSFGATGVCYDCAAMESTWAAFKRDLRHIHGPLERFTRSQTPPCSTTSRPSTTANATKPDSGTAPQPRPTLQAEQPPDSYQPVSLIAGQLHLHGTRGTPHRLRESRVSVTPGERSRHSIAGAGRGVREYEGGYFFAEQTRTPGLTCLRSLVLPRGVIHRRRSPCRRGSTLQACT